VSGNNGIAVDVSICKRDPKKMATGYRFGDREFPLFITFAVINWIDAFSRPLYKNPLLKAFAIVIRRKVYNYMKGMLDLQLFVILLPNAKPVVNNDLSDPLQHLNQRGDCRVPA
jgi:hypothetical protein